MAHDGPATYPRYRQVVLDAPDHRALADFYRELLGFVWRPGDEPPGDGTEDGADSFLVVHHPSGRPRLGFQRVPDLVPATWPQGAVPQQVHVDLDVADRMELEVQHRRALALGARLLEDRSDDEDEPLRVYADPAGHPFCLFVDGP